MQITIKTPIRFETEEDCKKVLEVLNQISDQLLCVELYEGKPAIYTWFEVQEKKRLQKAESKELTV